MTTISKVLLASVSLAALCSLAACGGGGDGDGTAVGSATATSSIQGDAFLSQVNTLINTVGENGDLAAVENYTATFPEGNDPAPLG